MPATSGRTWGSAKEHAHGRTRALYLRGPHNMGAAGPVKHPEIVPHRKAPTRCLLHRSEHGALRKHTTITHATAYTILVLNNAAPGPGAKAEGRNGTDRPHPCPSRHSDSH